MSLSNLLQQFETLVQADAPNQAQCEKIITELKVLSSSNDIVENAASLDKKTIEESRKFEELLVIYSVKTKNFDELEKAYKRLRFYNEDLAKVINPSENYDKIAAIYLLYLLSFNRFSDFHIELEKIPEELQKNQYIQFTIKLEQWLTVGNYSNVLQSKKNSPLAYFNVFLERIFETIRYEVSRSAEKAYTKLSLSEAQKMFMLNSPQELKAYVQQEEKNASEKGIKWKIEGDYLYFVPVQEDTNKLAFANGITDILNYTNELERIV